MSPQGRCWHFSFSVSPSSEALECIINADVKRIYCGYTAKENEGFLEGHVVFFNTTRGPAAKRTIGNPDTIQVVKHKSWEEIKENHQFETVLRDDNNSHGGRSFAKRKKSGETKSKSEEKRPSKKRKTQSRTSLKAKLLEKAIEEKPHIILKSKETGKKLRALDLFTGVGGIARALSGYISHVAYCDIDPFCRDVIRSRIEDGDLEEAPIYEDVRLLKAVDCDIIIESSPCTGFSGLGKHEGFENIASGLFKDMMNIVQNSTAKMVFMENVPGIIHEMPQISSWFDKLGFDIAYTVLAASDVGALHKRKRWFGLACKRCIDPPSSLVEGGEDSMDDVDKMLRADLEAEAPPRFLGRDDDPIWDQRCSVMGNGVCPLQVRTAFKFLCKVFRNHDVELLETPPGATPPISGFFVDNKMHEICTSVPRLNPREPPNILLRAENYVYDGDTRNSTDPIEKVGYKYWSTPRWGKTGPSRVLTNRSSRDLPTQMRFAGETKNIEGRPNAHFLEYLMGYPKGWTKPREEKQT